MSAKALAARAQRAEAIGYSTYVLSDHLLSSLAPNVALAVIAGATEKLRIGHFVLNNDLRHPAVLAQELASLDVLSEGRLEIGIGAGWNEPEYKWSGIPFEAVPTETICSDETAIIRRTRVVAFQSQGCRWVPGWWTCMANTTWPPLTKRRA